MLAFDRTDASAAAHVALLNELRGEAAAAVRDRDALQKSSERQVLNAERRCEHAEKVSAEAERRAAAAEEAAEARVQALEEHIARADAVDRRNAQLDRDLVREVKRRKDLHNALEDLKGRIRVYLRVRPMNDKEKTAHEVCCERSGQTGVVVKRPDRKPPQDRQHFEFDRVFAGEAAQDAVFADVKALVLSCVDGFNVCIFAYGQSGSGKTYTMAGGGGPVRDAVDLESWAVAASAGVIPRSCVEIFRVLDERAALNSYEVELSMYELYRDALRDLLADRKDKKPPCFVFRDGVSACVAVPRHRRDGITHRSMCPHRSVKLAQHTRDGLAAVEGGVCRQATSLEELVALLDKGLEQRAVAHTELNAESSRSHLLVSIVLTSTNRRSGKKTRGKLMLVDLAGSERVEKSGVQGDELKEAASINKSLSAIGDVIAALSQKSKHVPYRNHPLTMLMSDSIGGTAKTLMIVNASPSSEHASETANSLTFGSGASASKQQWRRDGGAAQGPARRTDRMKATGAARAFRKGRSCRGGRRGAAAGIILLLPSKRYRRRRRDPPGHGYSQNYTDGALGAIAVTPHVDRAVAEVLCFLFSVRPRALPSRLSAGPRRTASETRRLSPSARSPGRAESPPRSQRRRRCPSRRARR